MNEYTYRALTSGGKNKTGKLEAKDSKEAMKKAKATVKDYYVLTIDDPFTKPATLAEKTAVEEAEKAAKAEEKPKRKRAPRVRLE